MKKVEAAQIESSEEVVSEMFWAFEKKLSMERVDKEIVLVIDGYKYKFPASFITDIREKICNG